MNLHKISHKKILATLSFLYDSTSIWQQFRCESSAPFFRQRLNICSGLISRAQAEDLLHDQEIGSFLIRLSDKIWGYTISYKCEERIKHFLIDAMNFKKVKFDGNSEKMHKDLHALITFHEVKLLHDHMQCI